MRTPPAKHTSRPSSTVCRACADRQMLSRGPKSPCYQPKPRSAATNVEKLGAGTGKPNPDQSSTFAPLIRRMNSSFVVEAAKLLGQLLHRIHRMHRC